MESSVIPEPVNSRSNGDSDIFSFLISRNPPPVEPSGKDHSVAGGSNWGLGKSQLDFYIN